MSQHLSIRIPWKDNGYMYNHITDNLYNYDEMMNVLAN